MFIKNTIENDIENVSYEGYNFTLPAGKVCAIWDEAGKFLVEHYKPKGTGGAPLPCVMLAQKEDWDKKTYTIVTRFQIDPRCIPEVEDLYRIAVKRNVPQAKIDELRDTGSTTNEDIVAVINRLPIPDEVRFPADTEETNED